MKALWDIFVNGLFQNVQIVLVFLVGAGSGLGNFEMLFITASGKTSENPSVVFL